MTHLRHDRKEKSSVVQYAIGNYRAIDKICLTLSLMQASCLPSLVLNKIQIQMMYLLAFLFITPALGRANF